MKKSAAILLVSVLSLAIVLTNCEKKETAPSPETGEVSPALVKRKVLYASAGSSQPVSESVYEYDAQQNLVKLSDYYYDQSQKKLSSYFIFAYNSAGQLLQKTQFSRYFSDKFSEGEKVTYEYEGDLLVKEVKYFQGKAVSLLQYQYQNGHLVKKSSFNEHNASIGYTEYTYNSQGRLSKEAEFNPDGEKLRYTHLVYRKNRLTEKSLFTVENQLMESLQYTYDQGNRLSSEQFTYMNPLLCVLRPMLTRYEY